MMRFLAISLTAFALTGCGGYASTSEAFRKSLSRGQPEVALDAANDALGVDTAEQLPSEQTADTPLLLLERGTILQALGNYELSSRDLQIADKQLEVFDVTSDTSGAIAKYLFSDDATVYKGPPHEKLLINTVNLINYLCRGELQGAKVEARRFTVNKKYFDGRGDGGRGLLSLGSYLAGFAFEMSGDPGAAMRHYGDAADSGGLPGLERAVRRLAAASGATDPRLSSMIGDSDDTVDENLGDLLVIVQTGMAPYRAPERIPIGAAVVYATAPGPGARLSGADRHRANTFAAKGILKWVNIPSLRGVQKRPDRVQISIAAGPIQSGVALDVAGRVKSEFERAQGSLVAASLTRMLTRAVAGELTQAAAGKKNSGLGLLLGLAVEGALTAADTPDTRTWVTLPASFHLARARVPAGEHTVTVRFRGSVETQKIEVKKGGFAALNFSAYR